MEPIDQAKVMKKRLESSVNGNVLDNLVLPAEWENENECKLFTGTLEYLWGLDLRNLKCRLVLIDLLSIVCNVNDGDLDDDEFIHWLAKRINKRPERTGNIWYVASVFYCYCWLNKWPRPG